MKVIQIIGYKNSGKTTTAMAIIDVFSRMGIRVASLKHHGHGGKPLGIENTDSAKHQQAGALISGVEGEGVLQLTNLNHWSLEQMISIYQLLDIEMLVIEGFKREQYKKVLLIEKEEDIRLLNETTNIMAVLTTIPIEYETYPVFDRANLQVFCNWMMKKINEFSFEN